MIQLLAGLNQTSTPVDLLHVACALEHEAVAGALLADRSCRQSGSEVKVIVLKVCLVLE